MKNNSSYKIGVLGLGHWGTALSQHLANKGCKVTAWTIDQDVVESVNQESVNCQYLSHIKLSKNINATGEITDLESSDILLCVLPSAVISKVFPNVKINPEAIFVNATKGLDPETLDSPIELAHKYFPGLEGYAVVSGPGFAKDIAAGMPAGIVAAAEAPEIAKEIAELFSSDSLRVYTSLDVIGVELGGIIKNVIAIAAGVSDGLELGDSARAGIITRGLAEMMNLAEAMGADRQTLSGLSGLGDLVLTATCDASRNRQVGLWLGKGKTLDESIELVGSTAEGITSTKIISKLGEKYSLRLPVTDSVNQLLNADITPDAMLNQLINRPLKSEF